MSVTLRPDFPAPHYAGDRNVLQFPAPPSRIPVSGATAAHLDEARKGLQTAYELYRSLLSLYVDELVPNVRVTRARRLKVQLECMLTDLGALHADLLGEIGPHLIED